MVLSGMLAANELSTIEGTARLVRWDLLAQTNALRSTFASALGKPLVVTDGYRSYQSQVNVFTSRYTRDYLAGRPFRVWNNERWYQRPGTAVAAVPGTSNHGWAQALDLGSGVNTSLTSAEYKWMRNNAPRFGWTHPAWARNAATLEPWHWEGEYVPASSYTSGGGGGSTPIPPINPIPPVEDDMYEQADRQVAADTLTNAQWANTNATEAKSQAAEAARLASQASTYAQAGWLVSQNLVMLLNYHGQITDQQFEALTAQIKDVRQRAALATRKQYSVLAQEKPTYDLLAATYGSYEDMSGVRDPLTATVTVDATIPPGQIEQEVKDALVAAAPTLAEAVADENYQRQKE